VSQIIRIYLSDSLTRYSNVLRRLLLAEAEAAAAADADPDPADADPDPAAPDPDCDPDPDPAAPLLSRLDVFEPLPNVMLHSSSGRGVKLLRWAWYL
jgi:hypothetical protein